MDEYRELSGHLVQDRPGKSRNGVSVSKIT
jgi:hypothetical protein